MWRARPHYVSGLRSEYFRPPRSTLAGSCRKSAAQRTRNTGHRFSASQRSHGICKGEGEALIPLKYVAGIGCISLTATAGAKFCGNLLPISVLWVQRSQPNHRNQYVYPQRAIAITSKEVSPWYGGPTIAPLCTMLAAFGAHAGEIRRENLLGGAGVNDISPFSAIRGTRARNELCATRFRLLLDCVNS